MLLQRVEGEEEERVLSLISKVRYRSVLQQVRELAFGPKLLVQRQQLLQEYRQVLRKVDLMIALGCCLVALQGYLQGYLDFRLVEGELVVRVVIEVPDEMPALMADHQDLQA